MKPTITAICENCKADIVFTIPAPVSEYSTTRECPKCGHSQRITAVRA
jgi:transcription elongation factor Elf1